MLRYSLMILFFFRYFNMIEIDSVPIFIINGIGIVIDITSQGVVVILAPVILIIFTFILVGKFFIPINQNFPFLGGVSVNRPGLKTCSFWMGW